MSLWAEEGEHHRGRVRLQGSSFLNADELTFFDDSMAACTMEAFEDGFLKGFSVDRFVSGQQVKVFGRRKSSSSASASSSGTNVFVLTVHNFENNSLGIYISQVSIYTRFHRKSSASINRTLHKM